MKEDNTIRKMADNLFFIFDIKYYDEKSISRINYEKQIIKIKRAVKDSKQESLRKMYAEVNKGRKHGCLLLRNFTV